MLTERKNRGLKDIFIAAVDGLTGFPDAIEAVYLDTRIQLCIVHMARNSLKFVSWMDRKAVAADLAPGSPASRFSRSSQSIRWVCFLLSAPQQFPFLRAAVSPAFQAT